MINRQNEFMNCDFFCRFIVGFACTVIFNDASSMIAYACEEPSPKSPVSSQAYKTYLHLPPFVFFVFSLLSLLQDRNLSFQSFWKSANCPRCHSFWRLFKQVKKVSFLRHLHEDDFLGTLARTELSKSACTSSATNLLRHALVKFVSPVESCVLYTVKHQLDEKIFVEPFLTKHLCSVTLLALTCVMLM